MENTNVDENYWILMHLIEGYFIVQQIYPNGTVCSIKFQCKIFIKMLSLDSYNFEIKLSARDTYVYC